MVLNTEAGMKPRGADRPGNHRAEDRVAVVEKWIGAAAFPNVSLKWLFRAMA